jgi:hypothetical protein
VNFHALRIGEGPPHPGRLGGQAAREQKKTVDKFGQVWFT